jgi:hypothetical protein
MIREWMRYSGLLFVVLALQLLIFSRLNLGPYFKPQPYIWFIFLLPFTMGKFTVLFTGFFAGLVVDALSNTYGLHAAACTLLTFIRVITDSRLNTEAAVREGLIRPGKQMLGISGYLLYIGALTFAHHLLFFVYEAFRFSMAGQAFTTAVFSSAGTLVCILLLELTFFRRKNG